MVISACDLQPPRSEEVPSATSSAPTADTTAEEEAVKLSGDILIDGSSTVYPITVAVAEEFIKLQPDVRPSVGLSGTGGGFKKFCPGEIDISDASRAIKDEEKAICDENNIQYTEFLVAMDGLTVMVNPENDWLQSLTVDQLAKSWAPAAPLSSGQILIPPSLQKISSSSFQIRIPVLGTI